MLAKGYTSVLTELDALIRKLRQPTCVVVAEVRFKLADLLESLAMPPNDDDKKAAIEVMTADCFEDVIGSLAGSIKCAQALEYAWQERILRIAYIVASLSE